MGYGPHTTGRPSTSKKEEHEKPATAKGRPEERSLLTATGLLYPERQPFGLPFGLPSMVE